VQPKQLLSSPVSQAARARRVNEESSMKKLLLCSLLLAGIAVAERLPSIIHVSHLGDATVAVTCKNGADPTGNKVGEVLLISCGK